MTIDENTGEITVPVPEDATPGDKITVPVEVTYPDGSKDNVDVTVTVTEKDVPPVPGLKDNESYEPAYEGKLVVPGEETKSSPSFTDKNGKDVTAPEGSTFKITEDFTAPEGYEVKIDENTGEITVTIPDKSKLSKDTVEEFDVPVTVTYPDGSTDKTDANFKLDTDGDGTPDSKDDDDDNDGISDEEEKEKGSNPKDEGSIPATPLEPGITNPSVVTDKETVIEGQETDPFDTADNVPEGGKVEVDNLPGGLEVDPETGKVTGTPDKLDDWGKDEEERDVTVTVTITDKDGKEVAKEDKVITVQRDTDGDGIPDVTDEDDDNDGVSDEDEKKAGTDPKDPNSKPGSEPEDITPPTVNPIKPGDKEVSGKGDRPNEEITVTFPDGSTVTTTTDENGDWKVEVPSDVELNPGDKVVVTDGAGNETSETVGDSEDTTAPTVDPIAPGDKEISGKGDRPNEEITVTFPDGSTVTTTTDENGDWKVEVPADVELNPGDKVVVTDGAGNQADVTVEDTKAPSINEVKPGDKTVSGKGDRPNEEITVTFPGGKTVTTTTDENGNWKVNVPSGVELNTGDKVTATDAAGNKATAKVGIDAGKCAATAAGFGLPLLALIPIGLATQMQIPGVSDFVAQANAQIQAANTQIQQQAGLFNPQLAAQVDAVNQQLGKFGADLATVAGGLALVAAGILAGTLIYDNCSPDGGSSVKDLELKGSSGKTYAGSSKKEQDKAGASKEDTSSKQQEGSSEKK